MGERAEANRKDDGVCLTRAVLEALPPLDRGDEAIAAAIEGLLDAVELLQQDDIERTEA